MSLIIGRARLRQGFGGQGLAKVSQNSQQVKGLYKKKPSETLYYG
jgi:hypothetical protein